VSKGRGRRGKGSRDCSLLYFPPPPEPNPIGAGPLDLRGGRKQAGRRGSGRKPLYGSRLLARKFRSRFVKQYAHNSLKREGGNQPRQRTRCSCRKNEADYLPEGARVGLRGKAAQGGRRDDGRHRGSTDWENYSSWTKTDEE